MHGGLSGPGGEIECAFISRARVHGLTMRDDDALERKLQQRAQGWQRALLMSWRCPDTQFTPRRGQRVGEDEGALLGEPQRRLIAAPSVVESEEPAGELAPGLDELQVSLGDVLAKKEARAKRSGFIAADEQIDVPNMIWFENDDGGRRVNVESLPEFGRAFGRSKRIQN